MNHAKDGTALAQSINVVTLKCCIAPTAEDGAEVAIEVLNAEFFDEEILIIVYRPVDREHGALLRDWEAARLQRDDP